MTVYFCVKGLYVFLQASHVHEVSYRLTQSKTASEREKKYLAIPSRYTLNEPHTTAKIPTRLYVRAGQRGRTGRQWAACQPTKKERSLFKH